MTPKRLVFHVGLPKTGTTSIQRYLVRHAPQLREAGIAFPFDLSRRPKGANGNPIGVPQIDGSEYFFKTPRRDVPATSIDWAQELREFAVSEHLHSFLISDETLFNSVQGLRTEVFSGLPKNIEVIFLAYLRHPIDLINSRTLQGIAGSAEAYPQFLKALPRIARRYVHKGYKDSLAEFAQHGTMLVRSYEQAARIGVVRDFCQALDIPYLEDGPEKYANTRSFGYKTGLVLMGFRKELGVFSIRQNPTTHPKVKGLGEKFDDSNKTFLPKKVFDDVLAKWDEERPLIEARFNVSLQATTKQKPAPDHLNIDQPFAQAFQNAARGIFDPEEERLLESALNTAQQGFEIFKDYQPATSPEPIAAPPQKNRGWFTRIFGKRAAD